MKKVALIIILDIVAVIAVAIVLTSPWVKREAAPAETEPTPRGQTFENMMRIGANAIYVDDQTTGSTSVFVGFAVMEKPGYVEIYADDGGVPGELIGTSAALLAGGGEHVIVTLDRPLAEGQVYYAMMFREDKTPVTDADGNVIMMSFTARADAEPETGVVLP